MEPQKANIDIFLMSLTSIPPQVFGCLFCLLYHLVKINCLLSLPSVFFLDSLIWKRGLIIGIQIPCQLCTSTVQLLPLLFGIPHNTSRKVTPLRPFMILFLCIAPHPWILSQILPLNSRRCNIIVNEHVQCSHFICDYHCCLHLL
ncbi:hypothetical protein CDL12_07899 [Handroanthus impetiginosus]|uniref:Uncharacterized protein n=1 Tax=Handroanthus impetiginosus TaxID=429701 RepID=A0A2G9HPH1_9LAMI|nr:hypothetical protein CDL12_07899 [Handroanthus impetiginosus]